MKKAKQTKSKTKSTSKPKVTKVKSVKTPATKKKPSDQKVLLVYGYYREDALPRAAAFTEPDIKLARKAAGLLGLSIFIAPASDVKSLTKGVRSGNVYASGDGFAPKITPKRFAELMAGLKLTPPEPPIEAPAPNLPASWQTIAVGDLVLAESDDQNVGGYWEVLVEAIDGDTLSLTARDFPEVRIKRDRLAVALLYTPTYAAPERLEDAAPGLPAEWEGIKPGHLVLASLGKCEGWYPAIVTARDEDKVTLHWQGEPSPIFTRPLPATALLCPKAP